MESWEPIEITKNVSHLLNVKLHIVGDFFLASHESTITVLQMVGGLWESKTRCTDTIPNTSECHGVMGADRNI